MGVPNYGKVGESPRIKALIVGALDAATRAVGIVANAGETEVSFEKGAILAKGSDGKYTLLAVADLDTAIAAFPGETFALLEEPVTIAATSEVSAQVVLRAEIAKDLVLLESTAFEELEAAVQAKVENLLLGSGLIPRTIKR
ncbi:hypothetical protein L2W58_08080 [Dethiosulfovibrio sp. F2B]|uniref:hypothetical protein n=1 Tax=Dethiosulfovibrio faecalis TaxID=2720018 RepID=UPI001F33BEC9|nr:hypothetical protein [Dethiosulfovibrio faecalis]MCF4151759.1 hypothetical protein [Dethiosulfovibrio faecalis]